MLGPRVEDLVPLLIEKRCCLGNGALDDGIARGVQRLGEDLLEDSCGIGSRLGGLDDSGAACCDGPDERTNGKLEGKIIRSTLMSASVPYEIKRNKVLPNNQRRTQRILPNPWPHQHIRKGDILGFLIFGKPLQIIRHEHAVIHAPRYLDKIRLKRRLAEIALARLADERLIVLQRPVQFAQLLDAEFERARLV